MVTAIKQIGAVENTMPSKITVASDFSKTPGPRYRTQGPYSGEDFREKVLAPAIRKFGSIVVDLDGTEGYGSSFIDEAFGGLVRFHQMDKKSLLTNIEIISFEDPLLVDDVKSAINSAKTVS